MSFIIKKTNNTITKSMKMILRFFVFRFILWPKSFQQVLKSEICTNADKTEFFLIMISALKD